MDHRFGIGERVTYCEKRFPTGLWTTQLIVVEHLTGTSARQYRLKVDGAGTEYVLAEQELLPYNPHHIRRSEPSPWTA
jgi:hypothetical protein